MALIGIMGGTFNPIHLGHIAIAKAAYEQFHLDEVWFMPNHIPAYKPNHPLISGEKRFAMIQLAIQEYPYFRASDFELQRNGKTYTYETLHLLKQSRPYDTFFFIMGADSLFYFEQWVHPEEIVKNATLLVAPRNHKTVSEIQSKIDEMNRLFGKEKFYLIQCSEIPCSSSEIREHISSLNNQGKLNMNSLEEMSSYLPKVVGAYIIEHNLYIQ